LMFHLFIFASVAFAWVPKKKKKLLPRDQCLGAKPLYFLVGVFWFQVLGSNL